MYKGSKKASGSHKNNHNSSEYITHNTSEEVEEPNEASGDSLNESYGQLINRAYKIKQDFKGSSEARNNTENYDFLLWMHHSLYYLKKHKTYEFKSKVETRVEDYKIREILDISDITKLYEEDNSFSVSDYLSVDTLVSMGEGIKTVFNGVSKMIGIDPQDEHLPRQFTTLNNLTNARGEGFNPFGADNEANACSSQKEHGSRWVTTKKVTFADNGSADGKETDDKEAKSNQPSPDTGKETKNTSSVNSSSLLKVEHNNNPFASSIKENEQDSVELGISGDCISQQEEH